MRFAFANSRADPWDRNATAINRVYDAGGVVPHGETQRWSYTVPTAKKCFIMILNAMFTRGVATAGAGFYAANVRISGLLCMNIRSHDVNVGNTVHAETGQSGELLAGNVITGNTVDTYAGGQVDYFLSFQGLEFDA